MGIQGLLTYIEKNPATRMKITLGQLAQRIQEKTGDQALLLCDSGSVVNWLLKSYDCSQIHQGKLSPYSIMYGGDFRCYGTRIVSFARAIQHLGIIPIFFTDGSPGSDTTDYVARLPELKSRHDKELEHCAMIQQVCDGHQDLLKVQWSLKEGVWSEVKSALVKDKWTFAFCSGRATHDILQLARTDERVCGVLSADTDFAVALRSCLFHVRFFDIEDNLGITSETLCEDPSDITCELVTPEILSKALGIPNVELLADLAILCGNDYTEALNTRWAPWMALGMGDCKVETVAAWLRDQLFLLENNQDICRLIGLAPSYANAIQRSYSVYLHRQVLNDPVSCFLPCESEVLHQVILAGVKEGLMSSNLLSMVNGVYWRPVIHQPVSLGQPCFSDLTLSLRKNLYAIMGMRKVKEYGRTTSRSFAEVTVDVEAARVDGIQILTYMEQSSVNEKLATLFHLVASTRNLKRPGDIRALLASASQDGLHLGDQLEEEVCKKAVLVCSILIFMNLSNSRIQPSPGFKVCELEALLVTCLACVAQIPPCCIPDLPPARAITVSTWFSHVLEEAYTLGSFLGLSLELPPPAAMFYPMAYVPFHLVSFITDEVDEAQLLTSPYLAEAYRIFGAILKFSSVLSLRAEILNRWKAPDLPCLLHRFDCAFSDVRARRNYLIPRVGLTVNPPAELELNFDLEEGRREEVDVTLVGDPVENTTEINPNIGSFSGREEEAMLCSLMRDSSRSDVPEDFEELSGTQEAVDLEECLFFTSENRDEEGETEAALPSHSLPGTEAPKGSLEQSAPGDADPSDCALSDISEDLTLPSDLFSPAKSTRDNHHELPVMEHRDKILELIDTHRVICIQGETGCGKSTKIPQFILNHALAADPPKECRILVTQPRRVAAIKLAERVAAERHERVGKTVGYCIGGERHRSPSTALTYCTTGYMLQALVHNPDMVQRYSHIILDEIHERSTDADFTLLVVRKLVAASPNVKIIVMSATMQCALLVSYFEEVFSFEQVAAPYFVGAKRYPVETYFVNQIASLAKEQHDCWHVSQFKAGMALKYLGDVRPEDRLKSALTARPEVTQYAQEVCTEVIVSQGELGESVLVFLPGIAEISKYYEHLMKQLKERSVADFFSVFILHSQVPMDDQKEAFETPPENRVHVILATNIAESSITLPKLRVVINFGIYRQVEYNSKRRISCLVKRWCSHASCFQRAGRAGRVFEGVAVHLFTERFYDVVLPEYDPPEILTAPIAKLVLQAKEIGTKVGIRSPSELLSLAIERPSLQQMEAALKDLADLGAIVSEPGTEVSEEAEITLLGRFSLSLPVDLVLCRLLLFGIFFGCPADAVVMAAGMSLSQDVFTLPSRLVMQEDGHFGQSLWRSMLSRFRLDDGVYSDAITYCQLFREWLKFKSTFDSFAKRPSRNFLARTFACQYAVRWERLLHLEASITEIALRVLPHIPEDFKLREDLTRLAALCGRKRSFSMETEKDSSSCGLETDIYFENDINTLKSLLAATFPHQLLLGVRECESVVPKERQKALLTVQVMRVNSFDPSRTLVMKGLRHPSETTIRDLVSQILPSSLCQVRVLQDIAFIEFSPSFSTNPKTALLRSQAEGRGEATRGKVDLPQNHKSVVVSGLSTESYFFWQFGERRTVWRVEPLSVDVTRPRHPFSIVWFRFTPEQESAHVLSWRYLTGLVCELQEDCGGAYLGIATTLQGSECQRYVSVKGITVLPSLRTGPSAILMALMFQPLATKLELKVDTARKEIVALRMNSQEVQFSRCPLSSADIARVNTLRGALSKVLRSPCPDGLLPLEIVGNLQPLLAEVLLRGEGRSCLQSEATKREGEKLEATATLPSTCVWESTCENNDDLDSDSYFGDSEPSCLSLKSFTYYPSLLCSLADSAAPSDDSRSRESLLTDNPTTVSSSSGSSKLSPFAKEFVPGPNPASVVSASSTNAPDLTHAAPQPQPTSNKHADTRGADTEDVLKAEAAGGLRFQKQPLDLAAPSSRFHFHYTPKSSDRKNSHGYFTPNSLSSRPSPRCFNPSSKLPLKRIGGPSDVAKAHLRKDVRFFEKHSKHASGSQLETRPSAKSQNPPHPTQLHLNPSDFPALLSSQGPLKSKWKHSNLSSKDRHGLPSVVKRGNHPEGNSALKTASKATPGSNNTSSYPPIIPSRGNVYPLKPSPLASTHSSVLPSTQPSVITSTQPSEIASTQPSVITSTQSPMLASTQPSMIASTQSPMLASTLSSVLASTHPTRPSMLASVQSALKPRVPHSCSYPPKAPRFQSQYSSKLEPRFSGSKLITRYKPPDQIQTLANPPHLFPRPPRYFPPQLPPCPRSPIPSSPNVPPTHQAILSQKYQQLSPPNVTVSTPAIAQQQMFVLWTLEQELLVKYIKNYLNSCSGKTAYLDYLCGLEYLKFRQFHHIPATAPPLLDYRFFLVHKDKFSIYTDARGFLAVKLLDPTQEKVDVIRNSGNPQPTSRHLPPSERERQEETTVVDRESASSGGRTPSTSPVDSEANSDLGGTHMQAVMRPAVALRPGHSQGLHNVYTAKTVCRANTEQAQQIRIPYEVGVSRKPVSANGATSQRDSQSPVTPRAMKSTLPGDDNEENPWLKTVLKPPIAAAKGDRAGCSPPVIGSENTELVWKAKQGHSSVTCTPDPWPYFEVVCKGKQDLDDPPGAHLAHQSSHCGTGKTEGPQDGNNCQLPAPIKDNVQEQSAYVETNVSSAANDALEAVTAAETESNNGFPTEESVHKEGMESNPGDPAESGSIQADNKCTEGSLHCDVVARAGPRETTVEVEHTAVGGITDNVAVSLEQEKKRSPLSKDSPQGVQLSPVLPTSREKSQPSDVRDGGHLECPNSTAVPFPEKEIPTTPAIVPEGGVWQEEEIPLVGAATAVDQEHVSLVPRPPSGDLAGQGEFSRGMSLDWSGSQNADQWETVLQVQIPNKASEAEGSFETSVPDSESPFLSCEESELPSAVEHSCDAFKDGGDGTDKESAAPVSNQPQLGCNILSRSEPDIRLPISHALLGADALRDEDDTGWKESSPPVSLRTQSNCEHRGSISRVQSASSLMRLSHSLSIASSLHIENESTVGGVPGSTQHMLKWFTCCLSGKSYFPFQKLCNEYRSTFRLTDADCWIDRFLFKRYANTFATCTHRGIFYVKLKQRKRRRSVKEQEMIQYFKQYFSKHGHPEYRIGQLCDWYRETHGIATWINEKFFLTHSDIFTVRQVGGTLYIGLLEKGNPEKTVDTQGMGGPRRSQSGNAGESDQIASASGEKADPPEKMKAGESKPSACDRNQQNEPQGVSLPGCSMESLSDSPKELLPKEECSRSSWGTQKLEKEVVTYLYHHNRMAFLSEFRKNKKLSWLMLMFNVCLTRKYFESRSHLFEVREGESFDECSDCYIILRSEAAEDVYLSTTGDSKSPSLDKCAGKENESGSSQQSSPPSKGAVGRRRKKSKKPKTSTQNDKGYSLTSKFKSSSDALLSGKQQFRGQRKV